MENDPDCDDATFVGRLFECLRRDAAVPPNGIAKRSIQRARRDVFMRDVIDFVALRFLHRRRPRSDDADPS